MKQLLSLLLILFSINLAGQDVATLYLIGDSTMADKKDPEENPEHGWGQVLPELMNSGIQIENHAVNGRSTRSFIDEGRWEVVREKLKPGDYVFIQFGHNDQKVKDPKRYTNPYTQYRYNLEHFVRDTREKGAHPILFSSIVRRNFNEEGVLVDTHGAYPLVARMLAEKMAVPFIDLQWLTERLELSFGPEESKKLHLHLKPGENSYEPDGVSDDTHLSRKGALLVASLALREIIQQQLPLSRYIKMEALQIPEGFFSDTTSKTISWRQAQSQDSGWYGSREAQRIAENLLLYQNENGGWEKNIDMAEVLTPEMEDQLRKNRSEPRETTIDNRATFTQMRYLAKVYIATGKETYREAFLNGLDFLFRAQYRNGGWPQFYPIKKGYYEHITFNDGAMIGVMNLLRDVALEKEPFTFVDAERRQKARKAIEKGLQVILDSQVKVNGKLTVWCAQHDRKTLAPAKARAYELPSLSGSESVGILKYLMNLENPSKDVKKAVRAAVHWFEDVKIEGKKVVWKKDSSLPEAVDRLVVEDATAGPLWARFYEIETGRPIFVGRDGVVKRNLEEIEQERRINYSYISNYAEHLLTETYPKWEAKY